MISRRKFTVTSAPDKFTIEVRQAEGGTLVAEVTGTKAPYLRFATIGSPIWRNHIPEEQAIATLCADALNAVIARAGPITHVATPYQDD